MTVNFNLGFVADAAGTVDAITATYTPTYTVLLDKMLVWFRATGANTSTTPTFSPNGLTARTIVKQGGQPLVAGDIPRAGAIMEMVYDATNTRWELVNPAVADSIVKTVALNVTSAQVKQLHSTPIEIIPNPGAGKAISVLNAVGYIIFNSIAYTGGATLQVKTDTAIKPQVTFGGNGFLFSTVTASTRGGNQFNVSVTDTQIIANKAVYISVDSTNPADGDSDIRIYATYQIIDL